jgi:hypothetical protein
MIMHQLKFVICFHKSRMKRSDELTKGAKTCETNESVLI